MKNLEKIAVDAIINEFSTSKRELIDGVISAKQALEVAQHNFKKLASPVSTYAKEAGNLLLIESASEEAITYYEERISSILKIPFSLRK